MLQQVGAPDVAGALDRLKTYTRLMLEWNRGVSNILSRNDEHRFVDVLGAGDRRAARVGVGVVDEEGLPVLGDPSGQALAELHAEQGEVDLLVLPDGALEGDRDDVVGGLEDVDAGIVIVEDPAHLLDDRPAHRFDRVDSRRNWHRQGAIRPRDS